MKAILHMPAFGGIRERLALSNWNGAFVTMIKDATSMTLGALHAQVPTELISKEDGGTYAGRHTVMLQTSGYGCPHCRKCSARAGMSVSWRATCDLMDALV